MYPAEFKSVYTYRTMSDSVLDSVNQIVECSLRCIWSASVRRLFMGFERSGLKSVILTLRLPQCCLSHPQSSIHLHEHFKMSPSGGFSVFLKPMSSQTASVLDENMVRPNEAPQSRSTLEIHSGIMETSISYLPIYIQNNKITRLSSTWRSVPKHNQKRIWMKDRSFRKYVIYFA